MAGTIVGRYELQKQIGRGAMGVVYLALDKRLDRQVAVKLMNTTCEVDQGLRQRFELEACRAAALNHPNILTVFDSGDDEGRPFFVTEYIEGTDLQELIHGPEPPALTDLLGIFLEVCSGLTYAHRQGVVHRDLKPGNIRVTRAGHAKIMDFGIARLVGEASTGLTAAGTILGTPEYMSPEGIMGQPVDHRGDIFAMGVLLYEILTRRRAFERSSAGAVMLQILQEEVDLTREPLPQMAAPIIEALRRSLVKDPALRLQSAAQLADFVRQGQRELDAKFAAGFESWRAIADDEETTVQSLGKAETLRPQPEQPPSAAGQPFSADNPPAAADPIPSRPAAGAKRTGAIPIPSFGQLLRPLPLVLTAAGLLIAAAALVLVSRNAQRPEGLPALPPSTGTGPENTAVEPAPAVSQSLTPSTPGQSNQSEEAAQPRPPPAAARVAKGAVPKPEPPLPAPAPNRPPEIFDLVIQPDPESQEIESGTVLNLEVHYRDPDGEECRLVWSAPSGGQLTPAGRSAKFDTAGLAQSGRQAVAVTVSVIDAAGAVATRSQSLTVMPAFAPGSYQVRHDHSDIKFWSTKCEGILRVDREVVEFSSGKHVLSVSDPSRLQVLPWKTNGVEIIDRGAAKTWHFMPAPGTQTEPRELFDKLTEWLRYKQS